MQRSDPTEQTLFELGRFEGRENRVETIVQRNPIGQIEKPRQPLTLRSAELGLVAYFYCRWPEYCCIKRFVRMFC